MPLVASACSDTAASLCALLQVGVYSPDIIPLMANSLNLLGVKRALVVHSLGLDELTPMGPATVAEIMDGKVKKKRTSHGPRTHPRFAPSMMPKDTPRLSYTHTLHNPHLCRTETRAGHTTGRRRGHHYEQGA